MFQYLSYPILLTCTVLSTAIEKISDTLGVFFINGKEALMITGVSCIQPNNSSCYQFYKR